MTVHNLTDMQVQKFISAIGGVPQTVVGAGKFTTQQLKALAESVDGLRDVPRITDDPQVNFAVDCVSQDEELVYDEQLYIEEINAFRAHGSFIS